MHSPSPYANPWARTSCNLGSIYFLGEYSRGHERRGKCNPPKLFTQGKRKKGKNNELTFAHFTLARHCTLPTTISPSHGAQASRHITPFSLTLTCLAIVCTQSNPCQTGPWPCLNCTSSSKISSTLHCSPKQGKKVFSTGFRASNRFLEAKTINFWMNKNPV